MNIPLISGQLAKLHVKLETEEDFELYGGTTKAGFSITPERPEAKNEWLVTIDEQKVSGKPLTRFDIYVRQISTGREWVVLSGKLLVSSRTAGVDADKLAPIEYNVTIPVVENAVDLTGAAIVTGITGPRGWSAYEIAVQNGFVGSEPEWLEYIRQQTATLAVEQVTPLMERAETAAGYAGQAAAAAEAHNDAAQEAQDGAENEADRAVAAADRAAQHEDTVRGLISDAAAHVQDAAQSAQSALANQQAAEQAKQDAQTAKSGAEQAAANAEASKTAAQTAEGNAKASADTATAAKTAAETAKTQALAAQSKAEQEAAKAEQNAALLGDSLDAMLGADFRKFEWVENLEQLYAVCPNFQDMETWYYHCPKLWQSPFQSGKTSKKLKTFYWYSEENGNDKTVVFIDDVQKFKCVFVLPKATTTINTGLVRKGYPYSHDSTIEIYAPNLTSGKFSSYATPRRLKVVSKLSSISTFNFQAKEGCGNLQQLDMPLNVIKTINLAEFSGIRQVLAPFPVATTINLNSAILDAASALLIVNNLLQYDAETMAERPSLTIGIHIDNQSDEDVIAALETASAAVEDGGKGWVVAVAWNGTATASTFALRPAPKPPVYAKVYTYTDEECTEHRNLNWCHQVTSPDGKEPEELGYMLFDSVEEAREYYGLPAEESI